VGRGIPKNAGAYNMSVVNRVKVYLPKDFESPHPLTIDLQNLFGLKILSLTGWKLM
jgi:nitrogen fixation protein